MPHKKSKNSSRKHSQKHTKTKLLSGSSKLLIEGVSHSLSDIFQEIEENDHKYPNISLGRNMRYFEDGFWRWGKFVRIRDEILCQNIRSDWGIVFGEKVEERGNIESLKLYNLENTLENIMVLTKMDWPRLRNLQIARKLSFGTEIWQPLTSTELYHLLYSEPRKWQNLSKLNLFFNRIGNIGSQYLFDSELPNLRELDIGDNFIGGPGLRDIAESGLRGLVRVNLDFNVIGLSGVKMLVKAEFRKLEFLGLSGCRINNEGARHLTKSLWPHLLTLRLSHNNLSLQGYQSLPLNNWPSLLSYEHSQYGCPCCGFYIIEPGLEPDKSICKYGIGLLGLIGGQVGRDVGHFGQRGNRDAELKGILMGVQRRKRGIGGRFG